MFRWLLASLVVALGAVAFACGDGEIPVPCRGVPPNGCPISRGVACEDPTCEAVYACRPNNQWELVKYCENYDPDAGPKPGDPDAGEPIFDASIDAPPGANGGPGCGVLQSPDCPLGLALACGGSCCGCEDLYVCSAGAWEIWGRCAPGVGPRQDPSF